MRQSSSEAALRILSNFFALRTGICRNGRIISHIPSFRNYRHDSFNMKAQQASMVKQRREFQGDDRESCALNGAHAPAWRRLM